MAVLSILNEANRKEGLPIEKQFKVPVGFPPSQLLVVSGSAFSEAPEAVVLEIEVVIDTEIVKTIHFRSNGPNVHRAFAPVFIPTNLVPDTTYKLVLRERAEAITKSNDKDWFSAALIG